MQTIHEGRVIQNAVRIISALAIATLLGVGCGKTEKTEPPTPEAVEAVEVEKWEPETVKPPKAHSDHKHSHDHGDHTH